MSNDNLEDISTPRPSRGPSSQRIRKDLDSPHEWLVRVLEHVGHHLPAQAPLEVFVHHNTLHAFQHLPFHEALAAASATIGARGYLREEQYRDAFHRGRITDTDLQAALTRWLPEDVPQMPPELPSAIALARLVLVHGIDATSRAGLRWELSERRAGLKLASTSAPVVRQRIIDETRRWLSKPIDEKSRGKAEIERAFADVSGVATSSPDQRADMLARQGDAVGAALLWHACVARSRENPAPTTRVEAPKFPRDALLAVGGEDPAILVNPVVTLLAGAFLDQGQANWPMPDREHGFFIAFCRTLGAGHAVRPTWLSSLGRRVRAWQKNGITAQVAVIELLDELAIPQADREAFVDQTLMQLPGWSGMFHRLEHAPDLGGTSTAFVRLVDLLAVRLCLDLLALGEMGARLGYHGPVRGLSQHCAKLPKLDRLDTRGEHTRAWPLYRLAQHAGIAGHEMLRMTPHAVRSILVLLDRLTPTARAVIWEEAYEKNYRDQIVEAICTRRDHPQQKVDPRFQVVFCIDDRCESIRRHFEELSPTHQTYGAAGFFNLAIAYQGIDDPSTFPLCPVVITPHHRIEEEPIEGHAHLLQARRRRLRSLSTINAHFRKASRSLWLGPFVTALTGFLATIPMLASVFAPWAAGRVRTEVQKRLLPAPKTRLTLPRVEEDEQGQILAGFAVEEKAARVGALLENMGLTRGFAKIVAVIGHDSSSVNNPHFAAYSCGACGGRSGGPNARLFARMANRPEVRERLRTRGIDIPDGTIFIGGVHDTCVERIDFFDVDEVPVALMDELDRLKEQLDQACQRNARERCRRFASAPRSPSLVQAHHHVEGRSFDLSQARPELGHATNASCVVGRRDLTRGVFLDRRAFLVSYDPSVDPEGTAIERLLAAVGPVGAGINLEYYFSTTDNERYGAGTKLPHNVTGLIAVMNGASSDLRTGLPKQMIEIHEAVRLQLIVEASPETLLAVCSKQSVVRELVQNEWVRLVAIDPFKRDVWVFDARDGFVRWSPPGEHIATVATSQDWYEGKHDFVAPALIRAPEHLAARAEFDASRIEVGPPIDEPRSRLVIEEALHAG